MIKKYDRQTKSLVDNIKNIENGYEKFLLYIGGGNRCYLLNDFQKWKYEIEIIEIWKPNVDFLKKTFSFPVIHGDIRNFKTIINKSYDICCWWHGPEHINKNDFEKLLPKLEQKCKLLILGCPEGYSPQEEINGNPYEKHLWSVETEYLKNMGFSVSVITDRVYFDKKTETFKKDCNHITAWKENLK